jgi:hypothetical protein
MPPAQFEKEESRGKNRLCFRCWRYTLPVRLLEDIFHDMLALEEPQALLHWTCRVVKNQSMKESYTLRYVESEHVYRGHSGRPNKSQNECCRYTVCTAYPCSWSCSRRLSSANRGTSGWRSIRSFQWSISACFASTSCGGSG